MSPVAWILVGALLGALVIAPAAWMSRRSALLSVLMAVVAIQAIYLGASLNSPVPVMLGELAVALVGWGLAFAAYRARSSWILATVGVHAFVDGAHKWVEAAPIPDWYIYACLGFDVAYMAVGWVLLSRKAEP